jgi:hypothetical protein
MEREELIKIILGERYEEGREIAEIVLNYVDKNPDWGRTEKKVYKNSVLDALDKAVVEVFGHPLEYYDTKCRKMAMHLYHEATGFSLREVGEIFHKHHSTVIFANNQVENLLAHDRAFSKDYGLLEETFKKYL